VKPAWLKKTKSTSPGKSKKNMMVTKIKPRKHGPALTKKPIKPKVTNPPKAPKVHAPRRS